jgi:hypothetical protein
MRSLLVLLVVAVCGCRVLAGTVGVFGHGGGSSESNPGGVFVTSKNMSIDLGTRLYVGCFNDLGQLNATINKFNNGIATYAQTFADLTSNFIDFGTGGNFGIVNQTGTVVANQFVFNRSSSEFSSTIEANLGRPINVPFGTISEVQYSVVVGFLRDIYIWTAFNNEIALVRNLDGAGLRSWFTPSHDGVGATLITADINNQSEVLIGNYVSPQVGPIGLIQTAVPEPSSLSLLVLGGVWSR